MNAGMKWLTSFFRKKKNAQPRNGKWKEFNKHGVLISEGHYKNDIKVGIWRTYYETGELAIEEFYVNGKLHGKFSAYHMNGVLMSHGSYKNNMREGYFYIYNEKGVLVQQMFFVKDRISATTGQPDMKLSVK